MSILQRLYDPIVQDLRQERVFGLDIVRFIAIISVVLSHYLWLFYKESYPIYLHLLAYYGVDLFFVLSGYLIGGIIIKSLSGNVQRSTIFNFWFRRWFRTLPLYYIVLLSYVGMSLLLTDGLSFSLVKYVVFFQNFAQHSLTIFPVSWSLAIEEWYYLALPIVFVFVSKIFTGFSSDVKFLILILVLVFQALVFRHLYLEHYLGSKPSSTAYYTIAKLVVTRFDSIAVGFLLILAKRRFVQFFEKNSFYLFISGLMGLGALYWLFAMHIKQPISMDSPFPLGNHSFPILVTLNSFAFALLLPHFHKVKSGKFLFSKLITLISLVSYSMYLLHIHPVTIQVMERIFGFAIVPGKLYSLPIYLVLVFMVSLVGYRLIEKPFLTLRERVAPRKATF